MRAMVVRAWDTPKFPARKTRNYLEIEWEALSTRKFLGLNPDEPIDFLRFMDLLHKLKVGPQRSIGVETHVDVLPPGVEAKSELPYGSTVLITLSQETYEALESRKPRAGFSLLHETGHAVMHHRELADLTRFPDRAPGLLRGDYQDLKPWANVEWQADAFAASMKMPALGLAKLERAHNLNVEMICHQFGASKSSAEIRLNTYLKRREHWQELLHRPS